MDCIQAARDAEPEPQHANVPTASPGAAGQRPDFISELSPFSWLTKSFHQPPLWPRLALKSHSRRNRRGRRGRGHANSGPVALRRSVGVRRHVGVGHHAHRRRPRRPDRPIPAKLRRGARERRARGHRRQLPVGLHAGARADPARPHLRDAARALRLPRRLDAGRRRPPRHQPDGNAGAVEYLSGLGAALDQPARRPVAQDDLPGRPLAQRHRGELRPPDGSARNCAQSAATRRVRYATYPQAPPATAASAMAA